MAKQAVAVRLSSEAIEWADAYASSRDVSRQVVLESAIESFRADCAAGVPELRLAARRQAANDVQDAEVVGVGDCPRRPGELGHVWRSVSDDPRLRCRFCDAPGRGDAARGEAGFLEGATAERSALFARLRAPASSHGQRVK